VILPLEAPHVDIQGMTQHFIPFRNGYMANSRLFEIVTLLLVSSSLLAVQGREAPGSFLQTAQDPCDQCDEVAQDRATIQSLNAQVTDLQSQVASLQSQLQASRDREQSCQTSLQTAQSINNAFQAQDARNSGSQQRLSQWASLCNDLSSQLQPLRSTARTFLQTIYGYLDIDIPLLFLMELIKEKNLYCLGLRNSFLQLHQSASQASLSLWSLEPEDVYSTTDYQQVLQATDQVLQQLQVFLALDPNDCTDRLDYYLDETVQYYNRVNDRMGDELQAWLSTYQREITQVIEGMPYCANVEYEDVEALIGQARVLS